MIRALFPGDRLYHGGQSIGFVWEIVGDRVEVRNASSTTTSIWRCSSRSGPTRTLLRYPTLPMARAMAKDAIAAARGE